MRIIERGKLPESKLYAVQCRHCKSKFEFAQIEGKVTYDQRDGDFVSIPCPVCQTPCTYEVSE